MTDHLRDQIQTALGSGYRVERELGGGGMSRVFVARDLSLDRDVVVKVLPSESTHGVNAERFRREIQVIARLQHPHIVSIHSAGSADSSLYYLMPFIGGESLRARISREGPMPVPEVVRIVREVLDALAFAHKHGVIHRDMKPDNVLLEAGHAVVADFGIAKALRESGNVTSAGIALGTPGYLAPEQATADPTADHRADLYAVAVMAYEMLTGAPLFTGTVQQVVAAHITTAPTPLREVRSDVPVGVADVIMRALSKEPSDRPQTAEEMMAALDAALTPSATAPAAVPVAPRHGTKRWLMPVAALVVLTLGGAAWRITHPPSVVAKGAEVIAVMPFAAVSDSSLSRLGQDLVVTLSANLDGVGALRAADPVTVLTRARSLAQPVPIAEAVALARNLGARSVLTGTLIAEGARVRATAVLQVVDGDSAIAKATVLSSRDSIAVLTDSLAWQILRQVWRRGAAPSPVLAGLTTSSFDALRAFLDGEQRFQYLDANGALALYRRAFEIDTNFAQAYMRYDYVKSWHGEAGDSTVRRHLGRLLDRLPERERAWVDVRRTAMPIPRKFEAWKALAERYPDYAPAFMSAGDLVIHAGGVNGIPIAAARRYIDRFVELSPANADGRLHQFFVASIDGRVEDARSAIAALDRLIPNGGAMEPRLLPLMWNAGEVRRSGDKLNLPALDTIFRRWLAEQRNVKWALGFFGFMGNDLPWSERQALYAYMRKSGTITPDLDPIERSGEGFVRIGHGDWQGGLAVLQQAEAADVLFEQASGSARMAVIGSWMGVIAPATADTVLARVRARPEAAKNRGMRLEFMWMDGLLGVTQGDSARVQRAVTALRADTGRVPVYLIRALNGVWLARRTPDAGADSLRVLSDSAMQGGPFTTPTEIVDRFVIARALRRAGRPADSQRYLLWAETGSTAPKLVTTGIAIGPLVWYERGLAYEQSGDKPNAVRFLQRFVGLYDQPPEIHKGLVQDAKQRLVRLTGDAAR